MTPDPRPLVAIALIGALVAVVFSIATRTARGDGDPRNFFRMAQPAVKEARRSPRFIIRQRIKRPAVTRLAQPRAVIAPVLAMHPIDAPLPMRPMRVLNVGPFNGAIVLRHPVEEQPRDDAKPQPSIAPHRPRAGLNSREIVVACVFGVAMLLTIAAHFNPRKQRIGHGSAAA